MNVDNTFSKLRKMFNKMIEVLEAPDTRTFSCCSWVNTHRASS